MTSFFAAHSKNRPIGAAETEQRVDWAKARAEDSMLIDGIVFVELPPSGVSFAIFLTSPE
jgi:hypothetical protein